LQAARLNYDAPGSDRKTAGQDGTNREPGIQKPDWRLTSWIGVCPAVGGNATRDALNSTFFAVAASRKLMRERGKFGYGRI